MYLKKLVAMLCLIVTAVSLHAQQAPVEEQPQKRKEWETKCREFLAFLSGCSVRDFESASFGPVKKKEFAPGWEYESRLLETRGYRCYVNEKGLICEINWYAWDSPQKPCEGGVTISTVDDVPQHLFGDSVQFGKAPDQGKGKFKGTVNMWYRLVHGAWIERQWLSVVFNWETGRFAHLDAWIDPDRKYSVPDVKVTKDRAEKRAIAHINHYYMADGVREDLGIKLTYFRATPNKDWYALFLQEDGRLVHRFYFDFTYVRSGPHIGVPGQEVRVDAVSGKVWGSWMGPGGAKTTQ